MRSRHLMFHSLTFASLVAGSGSVGLGCASEAILTTDHLPVRRVIVYRNGVAYFERGGKVDSGEVRFKMKQTEVGDFLATLAVMEKGGSSVRAAAFPLDRDEPEAGDIPSDDVDQATAPKHDLTPEEKAAAADRKRGLRTVVLSLDGKEHDLEVGYVAASPVWRPSYRLVVHPDGAADLQAWGIVENLSGEDWKGVRLSLIAGSPLAFQTDLGTPMIPTRPTVTDVGEVVMAVPHGETSLAQEPAPLSTPAPASIVATPTADRDEPEAPKTIGGAARALHRKKSPAHAAAAGPAAPGGAGFRDGRGVVAEAAASANFAPSPPQPPPVVPSGPRDLRSLAAIAAEGGSTRYDLPTEVNVPDRSATMVMLLSRPVPGEALFLYSPDGGVGDSESHPFRVARFANKTGGVLERGPIAVFEDGSFLGQGLVDPLPDNATATVPFALERSIAVDVDRKWNEIGERVAKIENGELTVERDQVRQTKYRVRNGGDKLAKVLIKHIRERGARLTTPPPDTDDNVGTGTALVPTKVAPHATAELVVDERTPTPRRVDWFTPLAANAMKALMADPGAPRDLLAKLGAAWKVRDEIVEKNDALYKATSGLTGLLESAEETRKNLRAIEKNRMADALRATLTQRLTETSNKIDVLTKQKVEIDSKLAELHVRFKESLRDLSYVSPPTTRP